MSLKHSCPKCGKVAKIYAEFPIGDKINYVYQCGHCEVRPKFAPEAPQTTTVDEPINEMNPGYYLSHLNTKQFIHEFGNPSYHDLDTWVTDGGAAVADNSNTAKPPYLPIVYHSVNLAKQAYPYQVEGVTFAENANLRCLFADAMGVGKTMEALLTVKKNKAKALPCLALVKGATLFQWQNDYNEWFDSNFFTCIAVTNRIHLMPGFNFYILSIDMIGKKDIIEACLTLGIKTVIIDECQNIKNSTTKRYKGVVKFLQLSGITQVIALSGTPFKNRFTEYGPILNILAPAYFPYAQIERKWLAPNEKGEYTRLNPVFESDFKRITSKFIIRREKHEVLKDLPPLTRDYQIIEITDKSLIDSYNHTLDLFENWMNDNKTEASSSTRLIGWLAKLRAITGQAKCKNAIEWLDDFLESTDESIAIGIHHHAVKDTLSLSLRSQNINALTLSGDDDIYQKSSVVRQFTNGHSRVLVLNSIAGGVGLNLQSCANALVLERQWSSADEEQFEARFHRNGQQKAVTVTYMIAKGTIDEFMHDLVLNKKKILIEAGLGTEVDLASDVNTLKQLAGMVISHRL